ncbi:MAG: VPLPA-CTERM sorting domain-containing protein [Planctomycetota bacterium]
MKISIRTMVAAAAFGLSMFGATTDANAQNDGYDGQITFVSVKAWGGNGRGGPFEVAGNPASLHTATGKWGAESGNFVTFCIERNEHIREGRTYDVNINDRAIMGGEGGGNPDPLDTRTAFLYTQFLEGTLADGFNNWSGSTKTFEYFDHKSGIALQDAIWTIEDEDPDYKQKKFAEELVAYADEAVAEGGIWFGKGIGNVRVLNLYENGEHAQDQLTFVPLPAPVAMAVVGLAGAGFMSRRRRAAENLVG